MHAIWKMVGAATFQRVRTRFSRGRPCLYLTFDDGPHPQFTSAVMEVLERHGARGTFFVTGRGVARAGPVVGELLRRGHALGNHSLNHRWMNRIRPGEQRHEIIGAERAMAPWWPAGHLPFRPPHGRGSLFSIAFCLLTHRRYVLWSRDSLDYKLEAKDVVAAFRARPPKAGDILLFHDDSAVVVEALDALLPEWAKMGYSFGVVGSTKVA